MEEIRGRGRKGGADRDAGRGAAEDGLRVRAVRRGEACGLDLSDFRHTETMTGSTSSTKTQAPVAPAVWRARVATPRAKSPATHGNRPDRRRPGGRRGWTAWRAGGRGEERLAEEEAGERGDLGGGQADRGGDGHLGGQHYRPALSASTIGRRGSAARVARVVPTAAYSPLMTRMPGRPSRSAPPRYSSSACGAVRAEESEDGTLLAGAVTAQDAALRQWRRCRRVGGRYADPGKYR